METLHINWLSSLRKVTLGTVTYEYIIYYLVFSFPMDHHFLLFGCLYLLAVQFLFLLVPLVYLSMSPEVSSHFGMAMGIFEVIFRACFLRFWFCAGFCPTPAGYLGLAAW